ncbi:uncharacterized protein EV422DRAFT_19587 [Fimicolochytrium jonesii]|uniref:uncharacterized protein n=1 Tax=Fimicolochytrium jonesii TaxID=1396493 RepID=UPI0022FE7B4C|nr:uncharacterized protein EV422DRAFT_19587 [Fimicolochytrium jonesii]KAI8826966.1 hypothetical protein EV422DRAFT_19587 [Fimicolochytrium jonesii]
MSDHSTISAVGGNGGSTALPCRPSLWKVEVVIQSDKRKREIAEQFAKAGLLDGYRSDSSSSARTGEGMLAASPTRSVCSARSIDTLLSIPPTYGQPYSVSPKELSIPKRKPVRKPIGPIGVISVPVYLSSEDDGSQSSTSTDRSTHQTTRRRKRKSQPVRKQQTTLAASWAKAESKPKRVNERVTRSSAAGGRGSTREGHVMRKDPPERRRITRQSVRNSSQHENSEPEVVVLSSDGGDATYVARTEKRRRKAPSSGRDDGVSVRVGYEESETAVSTAEDEEQASARPPVRVRASTRPSRRALSKDAESRSGLSRGSTPKRKEPATSSKNAHFAPIVVENWRPAFVHDMDNENDENEGDKDDELIFRPSQGSARKRKRAVVVESDDHDSDEPLPTPRRRLKLRHVEVDEAPSPPNFNGHSSPISVLDSEVEKATGEEEGEEYDDDDLYLSEDALKPRPSEEAKSFKDALAKMKENRAQGDMVPKPEVLDESQSASESDHLTGGTSSAEEDSDQNMNDFVVEGDAEDDEPVELPEEFHLGGSLKQSFEAFVRKLVDLFLTNESHSEPAIESTREGVIEKRLNDLRFSLMQSDAWKPEYKDILDKYPIFSWRHDPKYDGICDACHKSNQTANRRVTLTGPIYDRLTLSDEDDEEEYPLYEQFAFNVGPTCQRRSETYSRLHHYKWNVYKKVQALILKLRGRGITGDATEYTEELKRNGNIQMVCVPCLRKFWEKYEWQSRANRVVTFQLFDSWQYTMDRASSEYARG